ncbi:hypothetical protein AB4156_14915 [Cupriavidus sp. 2MCAB6]|uniref:hypothetical protein n=1 Tax=Cupriavidus sp. 2MCAB6 TaxID=3232981 RepID=UPI003F910F6D
MADRNDLAILEETGKGEDVARRKHAGALQEQEQSFDIRAPVERQYQGAPRNRDLISDVRNRYRTT